MYASELEVGLASFESHELRAMVHLELAIHRNSRSVILIEALDACGENTFWL